jgi:hypothetical protein
MDEESKHQNSVELEFKAQIKESNEDMLEDEIYDPNRLPEKENNDEFQWEKLKEVFMIFIFRKRN